MIKKPCRIGASRVKVGDILIYKGKDKFVVRKIVWNDREYAYWFYDGTGRVLVLPGNTNAICWKTRTWDLDV